MQIKNAWAKSIHAVLEEAKTSKKGLLLQEALHRLKLYGKNTLEQEKISYWKIFQRQYSNILIYVLMAVAVISFFLGKIPDFFIITLILVINVFIGFWQEVKAAYSIQSLKKLTETKDRVIRESQTLIIPSSEVVVGDIVLLTEGSIISSDMRLIESTSFVVDESSLTASFPASFVTRSIAIH